jgi:hypothetical protein
MIFGERVEPGDTEILEAGPEVDWATTERRRRTARVVLRHCDILKIQGEQLAFDHRLVLDALSQTLAPES